MWSVLTHERNRATLREIEQDWSIDDLLDAHLAIQVHEQAERQLVQRRLDEIERQRTRRRR